MTTALQKIADALGWLRDFEYGGHGQAGFYVRPKAKQALAELQRIQDDLPADYEPGKYLHVKRADVPRIVREITNDAEPFDVMGDCPDETLAAIQLLAEEK